MERRMSIKEARRVGVMQQIDKKVLTLREASDELGLSLRQIKRVRKRYLKEGAAGLISKHVGKTSPNRTDPAIKTKVINILKSRDYEGFGPTFAKDKIEERHGLCLSTETIRTWMLQEGLWITKKKKKSKVYSRRQRRGCFGELIQGDGSEHAWFEERGPKCTMVVFVDDATSQITAAKFVSAETTESYQQILEEHMNKYGRPKALYVDKHAIFLTTRDNETLRETHFARVLKDLGIELICAHSPQAKGRVERANGILQDRLIKELREEGICSIEEGNEYLERFRQSYNERFAKEPADPKDKHRAVLPSQDLKNLFLKKEKRILSKDLSFQYKNQIYQIDSEYRYRLSGKVVEICEEEGKIREVLHQGKKLKYKRWQEIITEPAQVLEVKELEVFWSTRKRKPGKHHPWR
jgi:hypothetical protein